MQYYRLAGINISVDSNDKYIINRMKVFEIEKPSDIQMKIEIKLCQLIQEPIGDLILDGMPKLLKKTNANGFLSCVYDMDNQNTIIMLMDSNSDWSHIQIEINENYYSEKSNLEECEHLYPFAFCGVAFRNLLMNNDGIVIHSSSLAFRNNGIIFTAPPETGKSTHVRLWEELFGKEVVVVNDDTPAIRFIDNEPILFGTPWSGSSDKFSNVSVPLKAIVIIEQYHENIIKKVPPFEALPVIMKQSFLPEFDEKTLALSYDIVVKLLNKVDVYKLKCLPNTEAVEKVYQCIL